MKRIWALALILMIAFAGFYLAERSKRQDAVTPDALLNLTADFERDISQMPIDRTRLRDQSEVLVGDELAEGYLSAQPAHSADMQIVEKYVRRVGDRVASRAHRRLPYRFHLVVESNLIDAFALPGGHVFVGLGLLHQMTSEDELAFVLGHEIEHIDHYHAAERIEIEAQLKKLDLDAIRALAEIPLGLWQAGYSKAQELEADSEGLRLAAAEGYSSQGAINLFDRWAQLHREYVTHASTPVEELSQVRIVGLQGYFRSHPLPEERLEQVKEVIAEDGLDRARPLTPLAISSLIQTKRSVSGAARDTGEAHFGR
jgi:beta-barrel assembly-enhancing protease